MDENQHNNLSRDQLIRYSRHIFLESFGMERQQLLAGASALVVGLGGLGSPASVYLAAAGIGQLILNDDDVIESSNLQRQPFYKLDDVGQQKASVTAKHIQNLHPEITIETVLTKQSLDGLAALADHADVILDCCDNFATRALINQASVRTQTPLISAAAIRTEAQIAAFNIDKYSPCYHCLYPNPQEHSANCASAGVLGPLVGAIGSMQAMEAVKVITNLGKSLSGRLLLFDALLHEWRSLTLAKDPECAICSKP